MPIPRSAPFVISAQGIEMDEDKVKAIREWPTLTIANEVQSFHGLASFYRKFVKNFSSITAQLNQPIAYFGEKISGAPLNYSTNNKELYALIKSLEV